MSSNFLDTLYNTMREGMYAFDSDGKITHFNPSAQSILGYGEEELLGQIGHFIFHAHHGNQGLLQCSLYKAFLQNMPYEGEEVFLTKEGRFVHVYVRANPLMRENVKEGYVVIFWDINAQKSIENSLVFEEVKNRMFHEQSDADESEAFYEQIFETANLGICLIDKEGRFVALNPTCCKIYGYSEAELIGKSCTLVVPPENKQHMQSLHHDFMAGALYEFSNEWEIVRKDGIRIFVYASVGILRNIIGGPYKITTIFDITPMMDARRIQKEQEAMLVQQNKLAAMGELIGHIAHQWRQPLNVINLTTLDLKLKHELGSLHVNHLSDSLKNIQMITEQMSQTIDDFMNFYKPNKEKKSFYLHETISYATHIISAQLALEGIQLSLNIDHSVKVHGLSSELQQVILNLISNAKDAFASKTLDTKQICIFVWNSPQRVELCIEDNAGGIDEALMERIFEPYFTTKGQLQGSGIGLYICSMIMKQSFNGLIRVENISYEDKKIGARFILEFPK